MDWIQIRLSRPGQLFILLQLIASSVVTLDTVACTISVPPMS